MTEVNIYYFVSYLLNKCIIVNRKIYSLFIFSVYAKWNDGTTANAATTNDATTTNGSATAAAYGATAASTASAGFATAEQDWGADGGAVWRYV